MPTESCHFIKQEVFLKLANPAPVGLFAFALTTWLLSLINANLLPGTNMPLIITMALAFGGTIQILVGVMEFANGNTFGVVAFGGYGAFWWSFALIQMLYPHDLQAAAIAWYLVAWAAFSIALWSVSFAIGWVLNLTLLAAWVTLLLLASAIVFGIQFLTVIGGYAGLMTAALAFYLAVATLMNETVDRVIMPVGKRSIGALVYSA